MLLSNGKGIKFTENEIIYDNYIYEVSKFAKAKTLGIIVDDLTLDCANKMLDLCFKYYIRYANITRKQKHKVNGKKTTVRRDGKDVLYGSYKSICIQVKKLHQEIYFRNKYNGTYEDYKLVEYPKIEESDEIIYNGDYTMTYPPHTQTIR